MAVEVADLLLGRVAVVGEGRLERGGCGTLLPGAAVRARLQLLIQLVAEQAGQDVLPVAGLGVQKFGEFALGQRDTRREVVVAEPEEVLDGFRYFGIRGEHVAFAVEVAGVLQAFQTGGVHRHARGLPAAAARFAGDGVALPVGVEDEPDDATGRGRRERGGDHPLIVPARHGAVEGEGDRVDDRRLPGACCADENEVVDIGEVEDGLAPGTMRTRPYRGVRGASGTGPGSGRGVRGAGNGVVQLIEQGTDAGVIDTLLRAIVAE